jgi:hypothetical protein
MGNGGETRDRSVWQEYIKCLVFVLIMDLEGGRFRVAIVVVVDLKLPTFASPDPRCQHLHHPSLLTISLNTR